jgi:hypothetical protein
MAAPESPTERNEKQRKAYTPPVIVSREPLEAMAAVCTPGGKSNPGLCKSGPVSS